MSAILRICREPYHGPQVSLLVLSRACVRDFTGGEPYALISISDPDAPPASLAECPHRQATLRLQFHDAERHAPGLHLIRPQDARELVDYVLEWRGRVRFWVVHCDAGISRSAGVAAALSLWLNGDDQYLFTHYSPNMRVRCEILREVERQGLGEWGAGRWPTLAGRT